MLMMKDKRSVHRPGEALHALHWPHGPRRPRGPEWDRRVPVPVQEQPVELHHSEGHHGLRPRPLDTWVFLSFISGSCRVELFCFDWQIKKSLAAGQALRNVINVCLTTYYYNAQYSAFSVLMSQSSSFPPESSELLWSVWAVWANKPSIRGEIFTFSM